MSVVRLGQLCQDVQVQHTEFCAAESVDAVQEDGQPLLSGANRIAGTIEPCQLFTAKLSF